MFRDSRTIRLIMCGLFALVITAVLSTSGSAASRGSETKGRNYFRNSCKECHTKGAKGGEISPLSKTQAQWRTYFDKSKHAGGKEPLNTRMSDQQLVDVQVYLINHAADSPQPETCGK